MTTRLKRKLGDLGVDTSSRKANESFCLIGTPLPPLEKSKDTGEFVPLWKQEVRDEKGRRRLHGAFTGGFSAGYFNTVGSKEGWTPSTFVSSRNDRAKQKSARPEDFMDDEDLQELKDSRKIVDITDEMDIHGGSTDNLQGIVDPESDSLVNALASSLLPAPKDSAGARILKKMGWRLGQGIGPRVSLVQRKKQDLEAKQAGSTAGATLDIVTIPDDDEEASKHTYAPRDTPLLIVDRKDNWHGLGYRPGMGLNESIGAKGQSMPKGPNLASGFGLGALNDADEDDLDVYDGGSGNTRNRLAYDIIDHGEEDTISIGAKLGKARIAEPRTSSLSTSTFHDGQPVLEGFVLSDKPVAEDRWFPLPEIPKGWTPDPKRIWDEDVNKENIQNHFDGSQPTAHGKWKSGITAEERGTILGETSLPSKPRSVFDYMSSKDRERLKNIAAGKPTPPAAISVPRTEPHIAQAALKGFRPFDTDPAKQARYTAYLQSQASQDGSVPEIKPFPGQSIQDFNKELEDYAKSALIFKPMTGAMAGRFTSAAVIDHGPKIHEGLHTPSAQELADKEEERRKEAEEKTTPMQHAARVGMYGNLTRETKPWQPNRLLCKRFGVKDPNPPPDEPVDAKSTPNALPITAEEQQEDLIARATASFDTTPNQSKNRPRDLDNIGLGEDEYQGRDILTYERPTMDVFKAIFASDDEDSDDEVDNGKDNDEEENGEFSAIALAPTRDSTPTANPTVARPIDNADNSHANLATFKPIFIPRDGNSKKSETAEKKDKKKKKPKKGVLVSFELDEENGLEASERPKKKKRGKKRDDHGDDNDAMWVEKPVADAVKSLNIASGNSNAADPGGDVPRSRKRAIDFM